MIQPIKSKGASLLDTGQVWKYLEITDKRGDNISGGINDDNDDDDDDDDNDNITAAATMTVTTSRLASCHLDWFRVIAYPTPKKMG